MAYRPDRIPAALEAALRDLFGGIDQVNPERVRWGMAGRGPHPVRIVDDAYSVIVEVRGWSPTLHRAVVEYEADLSHVAEALPTLEQRRKALADIQRDDAIGVATLVALALDVFADHAREQRDRAAHAERLGIHRPKRMNHPGAVSDGQRIAVGHLLVDRSAAEVLRDLCGTDGDDPCPRRTIEHAVACAHHGTTCHDREVGVTASTIERVSIHSHLHGPTVDLVVPLGGGGHVMGDVVSLEGEIPETVIAACPGHPLADVVDAGPRFTGRTIASARTWLGSTRLTLAPDLVRVDEAFPPRRAAPRRRD